MNNIILKALSCFFLPFMFLISCTESKKQTINADLTVIDFEALSEEDLITKNIKNIDFIKLETNDSCLIRGIVTLEIDVKRDRIFLLDANKKIFVFDIDGKFLNTIGSIGTGPNEQLSVVDIFLDKENERIGLVDVYRSSFFYYSYSGKFLKEEKIDSEIITCSDRYSYINENTILLTQENSRRSLFNYRIMDINENEYKDWVPFFAVGDISTIFNNPKINNSDNPILLSSFLSDTIYKYDKVENTIKPSYYFKGKLPSACKNDFDDNYETVIEALSTLRSKGLSAGITDLLAIGNYIYFNYSFNGKRQFILYNTLSNIGYCNEVNHDNVYSRWFYRPLTCTDDAFVSFADPEEILESDNIYEDKYGEVIDINKLNLLIRNTDIEDNPILVLYKIL